MIHTQIFALLAKLNYKKKTKLLSHTYQLLFIQSFKINNHDSFQWCKLYLHKLIYYKSLLHLSMSYFYPIKIKFHNQIFYQTQFLG